MMRSAVFQKENEAGERETEAQEVKKDKMVTWELGENEEDLKERTGGWFVSKAIMVVKLTEILCHLVRYKQK